MSMSLTAAPAKVAPPASVTRPPNDVVAWPEDAQAKQRKSKLQRQVAIVFLMRMSKPFELLRECRCGIDTAEMREY